MLSKAKQISKYACYTSIIKGSCVNLGIDSVNVRRIKIGHQILSASAHVLAPGIVLFGLGNDAAWAERAEGRVYSLARFEFTAQLSALFSHGLNWTL